MRREALDRAEHLLNQAITTEPEYGAAHSLAALVLVHRVIQGGVTDPQEQMREAVRRAQVALEIDRDDPDALAVMGLMLASTGVSAEEAFDYADRAVAINPNSPVAWSLRGWTYQHLHRDSLAIESFERAVRLSPLDPMLYFTLTGLGFAYLKTGQLKAAVEAGSRASRLNSHFASTFRCLAAAHAHLGDQRLA